MRRDARSRVQALAAAFILLAAASVGLAMPSHGVHAHSYRLGDIAVGHVWAPPPEKDGAGIPVYGPILNSGKTTARLVAVSTPVAEQARLRIVKDGHESWPETIELPPGKPLALAPWRQHIWLSRLKKPLKEGDAFDLTLDFAEAGRLTVKVIVEQTPGH